MAEDMTRTAPPPTDLLERLLDEVENTPPSGDDPPTSPPTSPTAPPPMGGSPLGMLLQNPALLSALPTLMENLSPLLSGLSSGVGHSPHATRPHSIDRHTALLCALKPYLSAHRRDTAETVIRLCRVWDALEKSGISLTGILGSVGGGVSQGEGRDDRVQ